MSEPKRPPPPPQHVFGGLTVRAIEQRGHIGFRPVPGHALWPPASPNLYLPAARIFAAGRALLAALDEDPVRERHLFAALPTAEGFSPSAEMTERGWGLVAVDIAA